MTNETTMTKKTTNRTAKRTTKRAATKAAHTPPAAVARILAEAELHGDKRVAESYGVNRSTLRGWRMTASQDPALQGLLVAARAKLLDTWRPAVTSTLVAACTELRERISDLSPMELIGVVRTLGAMSVEAGALLGLEPNGAAPPADPKG